MSWMKLHKLNIGLITQNDQEEIVTPDFSQWFTKNQEDELQIQKRSSTFLSQNYPLVFNRYGLEVDHRANTGNKETFCTSKIIFLYGHFY